MTYYVLVLMRFGSRQICVAGFTLAPDSAWMQQTARNLTMAGEGFPEKIKPKCRILYPAIKKCRTPQNCPTFGAKIGTDGEYLCQYLECDFQR